MAAEAPPPHLSVVVFVKKCGELATGSKCHYRLEVSIEISFFRMLIVSESGRDRHEGQAA